MLQGLCGRIGLGLLIRLRECCFLMAVKKGWTNDSEEIGIESRNLGHDLVHRHT